MLKVGDKVRFTSTVGYWAKLNGQTGVVTAVLMHPVSLHVAWDNQRLMPGVTDVKHFTWMQTSFEKIPDTNDSTIRPGDVAVKVRGDYNVGALVHVTSISGNRLNGILLSEKADNGLMTFQKGDVVGSLLGGKNLWCKVAGYTHPTFDPIKVKVGSDYTATIHEDKIVVGCQTITFAQFDAVAEAVAKARKHGKEN